MYKIILSVFCLSTFIQNPTYAASSKICLQVLEDFNESSPLLIKLAEISRKNSERRAKASEGSIRSFFHGLGEKYGSDPYQIEINKTLRQNRIYTAFQQFVSNWPIRQRSWSAAALNRLAGDVQVLEDLGYSFWCDLSVESAVKELSGSTRDGVEATVDSRITSVNWEFKDMDAAVRKRIWELTSQPR